jgi:hypothetical protein
MRHGNQGNSLADDLMKVIVKNRAGSVEHYFHFLLGYCVPLVRYCLNQGLDQSQLALAVRECGPLTHILRELPLNLKIYPKSDHHKLLVDLPSIELCGLDSIRYFKYDIFKQFREYIQAHAADVSNKPKTSSILLIERISPNPFYLSSQAEIKDSGSSRRYIKNHDKIAKWLRITHPDSQNISLENTSIYQQFLLFNAADLVIAQHGAALGNLIFMKEGSRVIEIDRHRPRSAPSIFKHLSNVMKLHHRSINKRHLLPRLDPVDISKAIEALNINDQLRSA